MVKQGSNDMAQMAMILLRFPVWDNFFGAVHGVNVGIYLKLPE